MRGRLLVFLLLSIVPTLAVAQSEDSARHLPPKEIEVRALRPSDLPTLDARTAEIKPVVTLVKQTCSQLASNALRAMSSSFDVRRYSTLGGIAVASFRGLPAEYTMVYQDGIPLTNEQLGQTDLGQLELRGTSVVELIPSSSAVLLGGDAVGAAINFVSRLTDTAMLRVGTDQTSYSHASNWPENSYFVSAAAKPMEALSVVGGISFDRSTGRFPFFDTSVSHYTLRENNDAHLTSGHLNAQWLADTATLLRLVTHYFTAERGVPWIAPGNGFGATTYHARQADEQGIVSLRAERKFGSLETSAQASYQSQRETYTDPSAPIADSSLDRILSLDLRGSYPFSGTLVSFAGVTLSHTELTSNTNVESLGDSVIDRDRIGSYAALRYVPESYLAIAGSLRLDAISDLPDPQLLPQLSVQYSPISNFDIEAAYSRAFHYPTLNALYWKSGGDRTLQPEKAHTGQINFGWMLPWNEVPVHLGATAFYAAIDNEILWVPQSGLLFRPTNIFKAESAGLEFRANTMLSFSTQWTLDLSESYTLLRARNLTPNSQDYGHELPYSSPTRSLFIAMLSHSEFGSFAALVRYRGHEFATLANETSDRLPPVTTLDFTITSAEFSLGQFAGAIQLSLLNATDEQYTEVWGYPLPGRTFKVSIECNCH